MGLNPEFWRNRRVFVTGHTGFKGSWLSMMLSELGAEVTGYSLNPPTTPSMYDSLNISSTLKRDVRGDIGDFDALLTCLRNSGAEIVLHLAAQPLVSEGYENPVETYGTNVMGTVNLLEAIRCTPQVSIGLMVTSDKCYENTGQTKGYKEFDRLGGSDPYSNSKACAELVTTAYQRSFFDSPGSNCVVATARAGNVIGGGDWATNRLVVDSIKAFQNADPVVLRNPDAVRPWQHVLEPLTGYLMLLERMAQSDGKNFQGSWNFGPDKSGEATVWTIAQALSTAWGDEAKIARSQTEASFSESHYLQIDSTKSTQRLGWKPVWSTEQMLQATAFWYRSAFDNLEMSVITRNQIRTYWSAAS